MYSESYKYKILYFKWIRIKIRKVSISKLHENKIKWNSYYKAKVKLKGDKEIKYFEIISKSKYKIG